VPVLAVVAVAWLLLHSPASAPIEARRVAMGTVVTVKLHAGRRLSEALVDSAFAEIERIESLMSRHVADSEANRIEREAVAGDFVCSPEMAAVLARCQEYAVRTEGRFDVTVGALTRLWNFPEAQYPPAPALIDSALAHVGYRDLVVEGRRVRLGRGGIRLDLGAAAKGYAVDRAVARLQELGVTAGLVEAGGDLRYWGSKPDGSGWRFAVQHPRAPNEYLPVDDIGLVAIATSGDYEQFFEHEGRRYHHILDPRTGYPAAGAVSATAWANSALEADIVATTAFILGPLEGVRLGEDLPEVEVLVLYMDGGRLLHRRTSGLAGRGRFPGDAE